MATRATITVADKSDSFSIYQHYDGYPEGEHGLVRRLANAPRMAWKLPRFEAMDFAAAVISVLKEAGGTTYLTKDANMHSDRAYHYQITPLSNGVSTEVGLCISKSAWAPDKPYSVLFEGTLAEAVQAFDAEAPLITEPREVQLLTPIEAALSRATEEIQQWCRERPEGETREVLEMLDSAGSTLLTLRDQLDKSAPWDALKKAETLLENNIAPQQNLYANRAKTEIHMAMEAHRRFQRN